MGKIHTELPLSRMRAICKALPVCFLRISALAAILFAGAAAHRVFAYQGQCKIDVKFISEAEYNAFDAAKQESDPQKRASKLFDFIQKYPKSPLVEQISLADYANIKVIEDEYAAYYAARQAPDLEKRAAALIEFIQQHPQSSLAGNAEYEYAEMLKTASKEKKYELLESLAGRWLKIRPNDLEAYAFIAQAAMNLQEYEKCGESFEAAYAMKPSPDLARQIHTCYQKAGNVAKQTEWAAKLFKMPEFDNDYMLRYSYVLHFAKDNNLQKAAEYALLTLGSAGLVHAQDANMQEQLRQVRRACYHVIGSNLLEKGNYSEAIAAFEEALKAERYGQGYYKIGLCLDNQKEIEKAMLYYSAAELMGGEV
jgi:tetratricopeptide (TPR) repeat protein